MTRFTPLAAFALILAGPACAQENPMANVEITAEQLAPGVAVLFGRGGNIGVSYGSDGTILIDDQFAPLTGRIQSAVEALGADPVRFLINTHWHGDHTGSNENFGEAGALIMAHENVRVRMASEQQRPGGRTTPASPAAALPVVTYENGLRLHLNGDTVRVVHMHNGHTDGDSIIIWESANIIHMGDLFFHQISLPYIDRDSGGSAQGMLAAANETLAWANSDTQIIPGHGPMASRTELVAYRDMLAAVIGEVQAAINAGNSLEAIQAMNIAAPYAIDGGFIAPDVFIGFIHDSLTDPDAMSHDHDHGPDHDAEEGHH
jgi:glyoxylase-like metal-dependent hydrolase (beta-lactamase superfamily II)